MRTEAQKRADRRYEEKRRGKRSRTWAFIVYPDSAPAGWLDILKAERIPGFISPLHDADMNADETEKKPHWHVMLMFGQLKDAEQVSEISTSLSGTRAVQVKDTRAYARYLCHLDNPEKAQYSAVDVVCLGGADYIDVTASAADTDVALAEMMEYVREAKEYSFARLADYAATYRPDWFRVMTSKRTLFISTYLKSLQWEADRMAAAVGLLRLDKSDTDGGVTHHG